MKAPDNNLKAAPKPDAMETRRMATKGYGRLSVLLLYFLGFYIVLAPWIAPGFLGWTWITEAVGGEAVFLRILVGLLFLYFATLTQEKYTLKFLTQDILHAFNMILYGQDYRQHRAAVAAQIKLRGSDNARVRTTARKVLVDMTGQEFSAEHEPWAAWWSQARRTFKLVKREKSPAAAAMAPDTRAAENGESKN